MNITYFKTAAEFRVWLEKHHLTERELFVGFYKKDSGKTGITYAQAVDEALCFGWIDGLKQRVDELRYQHRFTPRKPGSNWSLINLGHVERLRKAGRMTAVGLAIYEARDPKKCGVYSFERTAAELPPAALREFQAEPTAWRFFQQQPPGYRRTAIHWVISAKQEATRARRLAQLIADSRRTQRLGVTQGAKRGNP